MRASIAKAVALATLLTASFAPAALAAPAADVQPTLQPAVAQKPRPAELDAAMRQLWEEHITYTRNYIISALAGLPDTATVAQRLLRNQDDIGAAVAPYYGAAAGDALAALLREHILIATEVVDAAMDGDEARLAAAQAVWSDNASDIAAFLAAANPNWSQPELDAALQRHLVLTTGEVVARLQGDWAADIASYDEGHAHMLMFADTLAAGIVRQFPSRFRAH